MERLESRSLEFLQNQTSSYVRGHNGKAFDTAVVNVIRQKMEAGETVVTSQPANVMPTEDEGEVEIISYGGKGGTLRIVHPKV